MSVKRLALLIIAACLFFSGISLTYWLQQPNNFVYTKEINGVWNEDPSESTASAFYVRIDSACAAEIYRELETQKAGPAHDFDRFLKNRQNDVEFSPEEISFPSRFKWLTDNYTTYDDPSLKNAIRMSFRNRCVYDKECGVDDSIDYLFVKIGIRYVLTPVQAKTLKQDCLTTTKKFYRITTTYNFGRSERHYRNGILQWLGSFSISAAN